MQCLYSPSNEGCVYISMILVISLTSTTTVAYSLPHSVYFLIQCRNFMAEQRLNRFFALPN